MTSFGYDILGFGVGGASTVILPTSTLINNLSNRSNVSTSSFITGGGTLIIPANFWLWANASNTAGLIVDTPNATIENFGYIVGRGGGAGGNAISITALGVTIINKSGAYIAGGGGNGGQGRNGGPGFGAGGGGASQSTATLGTAGANGGNDPESPGSGGLGGGAGGGSASVTFRGGGSGGQGGYIIPGAGGGGGTGSTAGVYGGSGGGVGSQGNRGGDDAGGPLDSSGGGGGWGAAGGASGTGAQTGGPGGKGIESNSNSFTLTNNGTIYGLQS